MGKNKNRNKGKKAAADEYLGPGDEPTDASTAAAQSSTSTTEVQTQATEEPVMVD